jgi:maltose O-acetyltransferase
MQQGRPELQADIRATQRWLVRYNAALDASPAERRELLLERLAAVGEGVEIWPPFHCDYGFNIRLGAGVFVNGNCVILDGCEVSIGDKTLIGPAVQILRPIIRAIRQCSVNAELLRFRCTRGDGRDARE